mgnify:FL=1
MTIKLTPLQLDENTVIYVEATEDVEAPEVETLSISEDEEEEEAASEKGLKEDFRKHMQDLQSTIFAYTNYSLAVFKKVTISNIDKVTLEFGVEVGGEAGIPYVTKGTAKSNLKIQVECSLKDD